MAVCQVILEPNDTRRLAALCGLHDNHIKLIESRIPVVIRNRGNKFEVEGEEHAAMACAKLLDELYRETQETDLSDDTVHLHLQEASSYQDTAETTILIDTPKIKVKPRGKNQIGYIESIQSHDAPSL